MINFNQQIQPKKDAIFQIDNRAFKYGDAIFETLKVKHNIIIFGEEHYFRLMASMRMLRMKIPMYFTLDFFENQILKTLEANSLHNARVRFTVYRKDGGLYLPKENAINFLIEVNLTTNNVKNKYRIDLFKDYEQSSGLLSTIKTSSKLLNVLASIFADENGLDNCILINEKKQIIEATNANIFLIKDNIVYTPSVETGCLKGIIRAKIIEILKREENFSCIETEISPFELLKADEVFLTNSMIGIQPVTHYKKKEYLVKISLLLKEKLEKLV